MNELLEMLPRSVFLFPGDPGWEIVNESFQAVKPGKWGGYMVVGLSAEAAKTMKALLK